ncbi:MAG: DUF4342 domain-containing protein [Firmicutes bacterium]|nr:DUF4342 domain-containing protein [Bacillota bacterium]
MVDFEQVQKLRDYANITFEEAKKALEETNGDLLEAVIKLEKENKIPRPEGAGYYSSQRETPSEEASAKLRTDKKSPHKGQSFREIVTAFLRWFRGMIYKGNINSFEVLRDDSRIITLPVTVLAVLLLFAFWIVIPLLILGLFFGCRYRFSGPDLDKPAVNQAMEKVSQATVRAVDSVVNAVERMTKDGDQDQGGDQGKGETDGAHSDY